MSSAFTVLPMSQEVRLKAGDVYEGTITVSNPANSDDDFSYLAEVTPYSVLDGEYKADLATKNNMSQIVDWITIENPSGKIAPNESVKLRFKITVPGNAPGGGQYATIAIRSNDDFEASDGGAVQNIFQMASIIYANIAGETMRKGEIVSAGIPGFSTSTPIYASVSLTNEGNVHEKAITTITVKNAFNGEQIFPGEDEQNIFIEYIMPGTSRYLTRSIDRLSSLGVYQVEQTVEYLGETSNISQTVIICPIWFLLLIMATIAAFIVTIVKLLQRKVKFKKAA